jgi:hypothetical protein
MPNALYDLDAVGPGEALDAPSRVGEFLTELSECIVSSLRDGSGVGCESAAFQPPMAWPVEGAWGLLP